MSEWKETDIGKIPNEWDLKTVDEIKSPEKKSIISGPFGSNISAKYFVETGVPVIRGNNLSLNINRKFNDTGFVFITEEKAIELGTWAEKNDIIFTAVGTIGQVGILMGKEIFSKYIISNKQLRLRVNEEIIEPLYAYYWFASPIMVDIILQRNTGSSVPLINLSVLKSLLIPIPPKTERVKILSTITSIDDKIDLLHRQNATLEAMAETLFRQWFMEEAKEDWELATIGQFVKTNQNSITKDYQFQEIEYLDTSSLTEGLISSTQMIKLKDAPSRARRLVKHNDILISTVRPDQKHYGIINKPIENLVVSTGFCVISCTDINPYFIYLLLTNEEMTGYLHSIAEGSTSTYPSLRPFDLEQIEFSMPPKERISEFGILASNYWDKININQIQIRTLTSLRDSLLPKLMSGEVRVKD